MRIFTANKKIKSFATAHWDAQKSCAPLIAALYFSQRMNFGHKLNMNIFKKSIFSLIVLALASCANIEIHKDSYDNPNLQSRILKEKVAQPKTNSKAVLIHSFWNNQGKDLSGAKQIDYSMLVQKERFYTVLNDSLKAEGLYLLPLKELHFSGKSDTDIDDQKSIQLSIYNSLIMIKEFLVEHPVPNGFKGASFPSLIQLKSSASEEPWNGYIVIGLEQLYTVTQDERYVRSGIAVVKVDSEGEYLAIAIDTYDFTKITSEKMAVAVAELINVLEI